MRARSQTKTRTKSVTAKVTGAEESVLRVRAETAGLTLSEWARQVLLQALEVAPDTRLVLAELSALRVLSLTLQSDALKGTAFSEERLKQLVEKSEREKFAMADKRIHSYRSQELSALTAKSTGVGE